VCVCVSTVFRADEHDREADSFAARRGVLLKRLQQSTRDDPTVPVRRLYDGAVEEDSGHSDELANFESVRTRIKRVRGDLLPPIPHTIDDVRINGSWSRTWRDRRFLSHVDNDWGVSE